MRFKQRHSVLNQNADQSQNCANARTRRANNRQATEPVLLWKIKPLHRHASKIDSPKSQPTDNNYNVVVIGCGHAGLEAALIASKMCPKTIVITAGGNIGKLSCNPSIGGVSKSQLVCELCCLGGTIGSISDRVALAAQLLNASGHKPANSLRLQLDKRLYKLLSEHTLTAHKVQIINAVVTRIKRVPDGFEIKSEQLNVIKTKTIVLTAGTAARSVCRIGECSVALDRLSDKSNDCVYNLFKAHGVNLKRFKTGTSPRLAKASVCWPAASKNKDVTTKHGFCKALNRITLNANCR